MSSQVADIVRTGVATNFNNVLGEFARQLIKTYPGDAAAFKLIYNKMLLAIAADPKLVVCEMAKEVDAYADQIAMKADMLFAANGNLLKIPLFTGVNMARNWQASSQATKDAIWGYLQVLVRLCESYKTAGGTVGAQDRYAAQFASVASELPELQEVAQKMQSALEKAAGESGESNPSILTTKVAEAMGMDLRWLTKVDIKSKRREIQETIEAIVPDKRMAAQLLDSMCKEMEKMRLHQVMKERQAQKRSETAE